MQQRQPGNVEIASFAEQRNLLNMAYIFLKNNSRQVEGKERFVISVSQRDSLFKSDRNLIGVAPAYCRITGSEREKIDT